MATRSHCAAVVPLRRIDQHVGGLETRKCQDHMQHGKRGRAQQGMPALEPTVRDGRRDHVVHASREHTVRFLALFNHPQGTAGGLRGQELLHEEAVDDKGRPSWMPRAHRASPSAGAHLPVPLPRGFLRLCASVTHGMPARRWLNGVPTIALDDSTPPSGTPQA